MYWYVHERKSLGIQGSANDQGPALTPSIVRSNARELGGVFFSFRPSAYMVLPNLRNGVEWRHLNCTGIDAMIAGMFQKQACIVLPVN